MLQRPHNSSLTLAVVGILISQKLGNSAVRRTPPQEPVVNYLAAHRCLCLLLLLFSRSVVSDSLRPRGLQPTRLLCPWDFPGKNTAVGCHFLFQGIFLTQGWSPRLLHWQVDSLPLSHKGSPLLPVQTETQAFGILLTVGVDEQALEKGSVFRTCWVLPRHFHFQLSGCYFIVLKSFSPLFIHYWKTQK